MMDDLFAGQITPQPSREDMASGALTLRGFALEDAPELLNAVHAIAATAPFRKMTTPGGFSMSVAMTNCGDLGWVTDRRGYRYERADPVSGLAWPAMPEVFLKLAVNAAKDAGYEGFVPNACLINRYEPGAKMSLHQDKDEKDFTNPIVSVSLGLPATFQFGGQNRGDPVRKYLLQHGDVVVWGGPSRLFYHGVLTLKDGVHDSVGRARINLTFRRAV
jgi:alkylated DNA repair protein (DNA oxidative demethylase)